MKEVLKIYLIWLIAINIFAYFSLNRFNLNGDTAYTWINPDEFHQNKNLNLIDLRVHWDSFWYLNIVKEGYKYTQGQMSNIAFFPLYPSLIWLFSINQMINPVLIGWIISTLSLGIGIIFLYKLIKEFHPEIDPREVVILLLIFPTAFFLNSIYTESLFLFISIIFFYFLFKGKFFTAAIFLSLASLARMNGLFLLIPFGFEYLRKFGLKRFFNINLLSFPLSLIGILSFMLFQYLKYGEPLAFLKSQIAWGRKFNLNNEHFNLVTPSSITNFASDLSFFLICMISGILLLKIRKSYGAYVLSTTLIAVSTGTLMSIGRFSLILFPIFILAVSFKNREFTFGWKIISILFLASNTILFVNNYWAG